MPTAAQLAPQIEQFSATARRRSADWEEYHRIANEDKRVVMLLRPDHVYGSALAKMRAALGK